MPKSIKLVNDTYIDASGVVGIRGVISSGNLNDYGQSKDAGMWYVLNGVTNSPSNYCMLIVVAGYNSDNSVAIQLIVGQGSMWTRRRVGSGTSYSWEPWYRYQGSRVD